MCLTVCISTLLMKLISFFSRLQLMWSGEPLWSVWLDQRQRLQTPNIWWCHSSSLRSQCPSISWAGGHWVICNVGLFLNRTLQAGPQWGLQNTWFHRRKGRQCKSAEDTEGNFWRVRRMASVLGKFEGANGRMTSPAISSGQGPRFSIRMVIGIFYSDTVFVQLNQ